MILVEHYNNKIVSVGYDGDFYKDFIGKKIVSSLKKLSDLAPNENVVWVNHSIKNHVDFEFVKSLENTNNYFLSYNPNRNFFSNDIGFVEDSVFINVNKTVSYPTWQMSSIVGMINLQIITQIDDKFFKETHFDFFLNSVAKYYMPKGLLCYSEPRLLRAKPEKEVVCKASTFQFFQFVGKNYKWVWKYILFFDLLFYKFRIPILPFLYSLLFKQIKINSSLKLHFKQIEIDDFSKETIDVIIPTIGRKKYLLEVLNDFNKQSLKPSRIIIIEQNPDPKAISELDYLKQNWSFEIIHQFITKTGACNARNLALKEVKSKWVFFADDDIHFDNDFLKNAIATMLNANQKAITFSCLRPNEKKIEQISRQWVSFGSGCSIALSDILKNCVFDLAFENGFGEDSDFGMQIRNKGVDIIYSPFPEIVHYKAPIGGFRVKVLPKWHNEKYQPKPSPTVMLYKIKNETKEQILGYKTILFFKYYFAQSNKNPISYFLNIQKQWKQSVLWANKLFTE